MNRNTASFVFALLLVIFSVGCKNDDRMEPVCRYPFNADGDFQGGGADNPLHYLVEGFEKLTHALGFDYFGNVTKVKIQRVASEVFPDISRKVLGVQASEDIAPHVFEIISMNVNPMLMPWIGEDFGDISEGLVWIQDHMPGVLSQCLAASEQSMACLYTPDQDPSKWGVLESTNFEKAVEVYKVIIIYRTVTLVRFASSVGPDHEQYQFIATPFETVAPTALPSE